MAKLDKHVSELNVFFEHVDKNGDGVINRSDGELGAGAAIPRVPPSVFGPFEIRVMRGCAMLLA